MRGYRGSLHSLMISEPFFRNGFQVFDTYDLHQYIPLSEIEWEYEDGKGSDLTPKGNTELLDKILYMVHQQIGIRFLSDFNYTLGNRRIWDKVNADAKKWHNDLAWEGKNNPNDTFDCVFLMYHTTLKDGPLYIRNSNGLTTIYPKEGLCVALNNKKEDCLHRGTSSKNPRILSSYSFNFQNEKGFIL